MAILKRKTNIHWDVRRGDESRQRVAGSNGKMVQKLRDFAKHGDLNHEM
jgi:hypothetical protein